MTTVRKKLWKYAKGRDLQAGLGPELSNVVIAKSKRGETGQITVRRFSGVTNNGAYKLLHALEEKRGKDDVLSALELAGTPSAMAVVEASRLPHRKSYSLARLVAEAKVSPDVIFSQYAAGKVKLLKSFAAADAATAIAEASEGMPLVVREMLRRSLPVKGPCRTCFGKKYIPRKVSEREEQIPCPVCNATGIEDVLDEKAIEAAKIVQEVAGLKASGIQVNQGVVVKSGGGNGSDHGEPTVSFLRNVHEGRDALLRAQKALPEGPTASTDAVEAEIVRETPSTG